ncbi:MAG: LysM peptidoglycan-binding domain-containing protein [Caulobacterales bacterium]|nr:LysM peptidoglycan-binding domain-containing protein [Caulobacterales bacterium]
MESRRTLVMAFLIAVGLFAFGAAAYFLRSPEEAPIAFETVEPALGPSTVRGAEETLAAGEAAPVAPAESEIARVVPPSFDVVRVDAAGTAVVAGRGEPGATAVVRANGAPLFEIAVNENGEWAAYVDDPLPSGAIELSLVQRMGDGDELRSEQVVVVSIPETRGEKPLVVLGKPGGASRVLQSPFDDPGLPFALLAIDYDDAGGVIFSGRAEPDSYVRVLADGRSIGEARASSDGRWSIVAGATLPPGRYDLQLDQLNEEGRVTAVLAVPFERAAPEELAEVGPRTVVVQPGNSLWRIARRLYGSGWQYTVIYQANEGQIRDPDLIYPGQIFDIPEVDAEPPRG